MTVRTYMLGIKILTNTVFSKKARRRIVFIRTRRIDGGTNSLTFGIVATTRFFTYMYLFNNSRWSLVSLLFLIVGNSAYRPSLETLNTPGIKVFDKQWRG
jgi:hypothetical protein